MSTLNPLAREISAKIVFYGPGLSGKTTSLQKIHDSVKPTHRGEMMSLATEGDRTLFFDFLPVKVERVGDFAVRLALYTVPGQVFYNATRQLVLQSADGVVFVADSQPAALDNNQESIRNLEENLAAQGIRPDKFPLVIQYNKRDLGNALPIETLRSALNPRGVPEFETCATMGRGILDTLKGITRLVLKDLKHRRLMAATGKDRRPAPTFSSPADGLSSLAERLEDQLRDLPVAREVRTVTPSPFPVAHEAPSTPGSLSALSPPSLTDYALAADAAFAAADARACVRACTEYVRLALAQSGAERQEEQAFLLGIHGPDLLLLKGLGAREDLRAEDAAFALYVAMQAGVRLRTSGLLHV